MALLTYREAAALVGRTPRCIRYWRQRGMPMSWDTRDGQRVRVVDKTVLQKWFRERLANDPAERWRRRSRLAELQARHSGAQDATRP